MAEIRRRSRADRRKASDVSPEVERRSPTVRDLGLKVEKKGDDHITIHIENEFVAENYYLLDDLLERLSPCRAGLTLELEMSHVPYADSEALGRLNSWSRKLSQAGARLVVVNPTPYVASIAELLNLDKVLAIVHKHGFPEDGE